MGRTRYSEVNRSEKTFRNIIFTLMVGCFRKNDSFIKTFQRTRHLLKWHREVGLRYHAEDFISISGRNTISNIELS